MPVAFRAIVDFRIASIIFQLTIFAKMCGYENVWTVMALSSFLSLQGSLAS